jgi:hypothetical protein
VGIQQSNQHRYSRIYGYIRAVTKRTGAKERGHTKGSLQLHLDRGAMVSGGEGFGACSAQIVQELGKASGDGSCHRSPETTVRASLLRSTTGQIVRGRTVANALATISPQVDPEAYGRELGVLPGYEVAEQEE